MAILTAISLPLDAHPMYAIIPISKQTRPSALIDVLQIFRFL